MTQTASQLSTKRSAISNQHSAFGQETILVREILAVMHSAG